MASTNSKETAAAADPQIDPEKLQANKNGLVPLRLGKAYGKFNAGEVAGFRPEEAAAMLRTGDCELVPVKK